MSPIDSIQHAERCAAKALELDDSLDMSHSLNANLYMIKGQLDGAIEEGERALELNPNGANALASLAGYYSFNGEPEKAIKLIERAMRLNPVPPSWYYANLGIANSMSGKYTGQLTHVTSALFNRQNLSLLISL